MKTNGQTNRRKEEMTLIITESARRQTWRCDDAISGATGAASAAARERRDARAPDSAGCRIKTPAAACLLSRLKRRRADVRISSLDGRRRSGSRALHHRCSDQHVRVLTVPSAALYRFLNYVPVRSCSRTKRLAGIVNYIQPACACQS